MSFGGPGGGKAGRPCLLPGMGFHLLSVLLEESDCRGMFSSWKSVFAAEPSSTDPMSFVARACGE